MVLAILERPTVTAERRAALYIRVSDPKQERDGTSLETQEALGLRHAAEQGYSVSPDQIYREVYTGVELWDRPQLTQLREAVRRHEVDVVIAYAIDRLARDPVHLGVIISEAEYADIAVEFVTEPLDNSPEGQLIRFVRGYAAKVEHQKIRERTMRGVKARIDSGKPLSGVRVLYGYRWNADRNGYEPDPIASLIVQRIYDEAMAGRTLRAIAAGLTQDGIPTPTGREGWRYTVVVKILKHPSYAGRGVALRYRSVKIKGHTEGGRARRQVLLRSEDEQIPLSAERIPALVDPGTWDTVQERLTLNKARSARNNRDPEGALLRGGLVRCGYCDHVMSAVRQNTGVLYRCANASVSRCYHGVLVSVLDAAVWEKVERIFTDPNVIREELLRLQGSDPTTADVAALDREAEKIVRQQRNLIDQLASQGGAVAALINEKLASLEAQRQQLETEKASVLERRHTWQAAMDRLHEIQTWCHTVSANLGDFTYSQKRMALDALGVEVRVWRADREPERWEILADVPLNGAAGSIVSPTAARSAR
jgi:site-specific DNA recombinase